MRSSKVFILLVSSFFLVLSSCGNNEQNKDRNNEEGNTPVQQDQDLLSTVQGVTELSRFAMELGAAEMPNIEGQGSYTFFAPRNGAFSPYYDEANNRLININSRDLISYHIADREYTVDQMKEELEDADDSLSLSTVRGEQIWISSENDRIILKGKFGGEAQIIETLNASNGIVHIIDEVLLPVRIEEQNRKEEE